MLKPLASFLCFAALLLGSAEPSQAQARPAPKTPQLKWIDVKDLPLEGRGWPTQSATPYDRLPAHAEGIVRAPVWTLSQDSSGMLLRFTTDTRTLYVRWTPRKPNRLSMGHMPATGVSGLDLYALDGATWRYVNNAGRYVKAKDNEARLFVRRPDHVQEYMLYLPLYNGIESLQIGIDPTASFTPLTREEKPIVFYGTSVTQGGCASRPGMAYPAILGRRLGIPTINLGFSGNGLTEPEMAELLAELDPSIYVLDSLPNLQPAEVYPRLKNMIATIRKRHPQTPIALIESKMNSGGWFDPLPARRVNNSNEQLRKLFAELSPQDTNLHLVSGIELLGDDYEATVDGAHPTDLGFMRMADHMEPELRKLLKTP